MGLTDEPFYKNLIEGNDTRLIVGTIGLSVDGPSGPRALTFPLFLVDYHDIAEDMEQLVEEGVDPAKKVNLNVKDGTYTVDVDEKGTVVVFGGGETAAHTAPNFWAEYTPLPEEHKDFQEQFKQTGAWMFIIVTKLFMREIFVDPAGRILAKRTIPLTDELRKMLGLKT